MKSAKNNKTTVGIPFELAIGKSFYSTTAKPADETITALASGQIAIMARKAPGEPLTIAGGLDGTEKDLTILYAVTDDRVPGGKAITKLSAINDVAAIKDVKRISYVAPSASTIVITFAGAPVVGHEFHLQVTNSTGAPIMGGPGFHVGHKVKSATLATFITDLVAQIKAENKEDLPFTITSTATTITLTERFGFGKKFEAQAYFENPGSSTPITATATVVRTNGTEGNGARAHILQLISESEVKRGVTSHYGTEGTTAEEWGLPNHDFADTNDIIQITVANTEISQGPPNIHSQYKYYFIAIDSTASTASNAILAALQPIVVPAG